MVDVEPSLLKHSLCLVSGSLIDNYGSTMLISILVQANGQKMSSMKVRLGYWK